MIDMRYINPVYLLTLWFFRLATVVEVTSIKSWKLVGKVLTNYF